MPPSAKSPMSSLLGVRIFGAPGASPRRPKPATVAAPNPLQHQPASDFGTPFGTLMAHPTPHATPHPMSLGVDEVARLLCHNDEARRRNGIAALAHRVNAAGRNAAQAAETEAVLAQIDAIFQQHESEHGMVQALRAIVGSHRGYLTTPLLARHVLYEAIEHTPTLSEGALFRAALNLTDELGRVDWQDTRTEEDAYGDTHGASLALPNFTQKLHAYIDARTGYAYDRLTEQHGHEKQVLHAIVDERYPETSNQSNQSNQTRYGAYDAHAYPGLPGLPGSDYYDDDHDDYDNYDNHPMWRRDGAPDFGYADDYGLMPPSPRTR